MKTIQKTLLATVSLIMSIAILSGCTRSLLWVGNETSRHISASYTSYDGPKYKTIRLKKDDILAMEYKSEVKKGALTLRIKDPDKKVIAELESNTTGTKEIKAEMNGNYRLEIIGDETSGSFNIKWEVK